MPQSPSDKRIRRGVQKGEALWLMSFSDMSLSLLCFFVLMISTMQPNQQKFENIKEGMASQPSSKNNLKSLSQKIEKVIKAKNLEKAAQVTYNADGLQIEFKEGMLFHSGSSSLRWEDNKTLTEVMRVIARLPASYHMLIEGHTDDSPLRSHSKFLSNWELSAARGFSLMRYFHSLGISEDKISVQALAHTKPKVPYKDLQGKALQAARSANRRVVIRIH